MFRRAEHILRQRNYKVSYHECQATTNSEAKPYDKNAVHLTHSGGYSCPLLSSAENIFLIAPTHAIPYRIFSIAFMTKLWREAFECFTQRQWGMYWRTHVSALIELLRRPRYWNKMRRKFIDGDPPLPKYRLLILYARDPWNNCRNWPEYNVMTIPGLHDEIIYDPAATLELIFDKLKA